MIQSTEYMALLFYFVLIVLHSGNMRRSAITLHLTEDAFQSRCSVKKKKAPMIYVPLSISKGRRERNGTMMTRTTRIRTRTRTNATRKRTKEQERQKQGNKMKKKMENKKN